MTVTPSERVVWGVEFTVRRQGYIWAMMRAVEGQDYENWERDNATSVESGSPMFSFWLGFSRGIQQFIDRREDASLDELIAEEKTLMEIDKFNSLGQFHNVQAIEGVTNVG